MRLSKRLNSNYQKEQATMTFNQLYTEMTPVPTQTPEEKAAFEKLYQEMKR